VDKVAASPLVLHVLAPTREGGLEQVVAMISAGQRKKGVRVAAVITPRQANGHPFVARLEALGVPVTRVTVRARNYAKEYSVLGALIDQVKPRIVHTHGYRSDVIGGAVARMHGVPTVSTVHGFTGGGIRSRLNEWMQTVALRRADAVIAVSSPLVQRLIAAGIPRAKIHCIPNGFSPDGSLLTRSAGRRRLAIADDSLVVGWVGRLSHEKGPDLMLNALALATGDWRLSMIGDGRERDTLRQQAGELGIANRVTFHGSIADAGNLLAAFDAFVLSSRTEGTPITLLEAMYANAPIVATSVGGVPDVVTSAHALLVAPEKPAMIAAALGEIAHNPSAAKQRGLLARERVMSAFAAEGWLAAVEEVYRGVSAGSE